MDDRDFFDLLYQQWVKTTWAGDGYWSYHEGVSTFPIIARNGEGDTKIICDLLQNQADAEFITAVHGCFGDLVRRLHAALDEADRADFDRDSRECRIAELEAEVDELRAELGRSEDKRPDRLEDHG